jgi:hypothetical protein
MSIPFVFVGKKTVSMEKSCRRQRTCQEQEGMSTPFVFVGKKTVSMEKSCRRHCISIFLNSEPELSPWTGQEAGSQKNRSWILQGYACTSLIWLAGLLAPVWLSESDSPCMHAVERDGGLGIQAQDQWQKLLRSLKKTLQSKSEQRTGHRRLTRAAVATRQQCQGVGRRWSQQMEASCFVTCQLN